MPAVTVDNILALERITRPGPDSVVRPVTTITTAPSGFEGEGFPVRRGFAGIPHQKGRAWHGIKRRYATESKGEKGRDKQSGTRNETLDHLYVQDDLAPKVELARKLAQLARTPSPTVSKEV